MQSLKPAVPILLSLFLFFSAYSNIFLLKTLADGVTPEEAKQLRDEIDALDTVALLGERDRFATSVEWIGKNLQSDINLRFEVFDCCKTTADIQFYDVFGNVLHKWSKSKEVDSGTHRNFADA